MSRLLAFITLALLSATAFATTPTISNVSGTVSTGQTLTITGSTMVDHSTTSWNMSGIDWNFEGSSYGADGYAVPTDDNQGRCARTTSPPYAGITYDSSVRLLGSKSIRFYQSGAFSGPGVGGCYIYTTPTPTVGSDFYVSAYVRYDSSAGGDEWPDNFFKLFLTVGGTNQFYFQPDTRIDNGGPASRMEMYENYTLTYGNIPGGPIKNNRWYYMEARYKNSAPKRYQAWVDGVQIGDWVPTGNVNSPPYFMIGMVNMSATSSSFDMKLNVDRYVVSSARIYPASKIEIGNNATYGSGTRVWQEPIYLSDGSIQIKADLTGLGAGPYYLWVTNNKQETSATYNLSGGGGDTTPPVISGGSPSGEQAYGTTAVNMTVTTNENATCKFGTTDAAYASLPSTFSTTGGTSHSQSVSVSNGGSYTRYVRCIDGTGNANTSSTVISWTVAASAPSQTILLSENFENSNFSSRGWYDGAMTAIETSGCQSGNCLKWTWNSGQSQPVSSTTLRYDITDTDSLYVSVYVKFDANWRGSGQTYHPHMMLFPSSLDSEYAPLAYNYLQTYLEMIADTSSPYAIRPSVAIQDSQRVNTSPTPPNDITATTETRSVAHCNGCKTGSACGDVQTCYSLGGGQWYSARAWTDTSVNIGKSAWHKIEMYARMNTISGSIAQADGILQTWIDGVQSENLSNVIYRTNQDATKKFGYVVLAPWIGDGSPITQTMWLDTLVVADAPPGSPSTYTVTPSAGANGTISPNTAQTVNSGSTTSFAVTPNSGYTASVGGTCGGSLVGTTYTTNAITGNCTVAATFADQTAPTTPAALTATVASTTQINLSWSASTDGGGIVGYSIERCSGASCTSWAEIQSTTGTGTTYSNTGLTANTTYRYRVRSRDATPNYSGYSPIASATTTLTHTVTGTAGSNGSISPTSQTVNSGATATLTVTPASGYTASASGCGGSLVGTTYTTAAITGNCTVIATFADTTAPSVAITAPSAGSTAAGSIAVSATATDGVGVVGVQFKLDGSNLGAEDTAAPHTITWATTGTSDGAHALTATARDAAGNSATSAAVNVTVDNTPPTASNPQPTGTLARGTSAVTVTVTTSETAECRRSSTAGFAWASGTAYTATNSTTHTGTVTATPGRNHRIYTLCRDPAGNQSTQAVATFFVPRKPMHKVW